MVKKLKENLQVETAVKKDKKQTIINLSRDISVPVSYEVYGIKETFMLPACSRQTLPQEAKIITHSNLIKVVQYE